MMNKINITSLATLVGSTALLAVAIAEIGFIDQARAQSIQLQKKTELSETTKLQQNDNLDPTVNRTSAMRTEAETGSIAPITGKQPVVISKRTTKVAPKAVKKKIWHIY